MGKEVKAIHKGNLKGHFRWRIQQNEAILLAKRCKLDQRPSNEGPRPTRERERQSEVSPTWHHFRRKHFLNGPNQETKLKGEAHVLENHLGR